MKLLGSADASSRRDYRPAVVMFTDVHGFSRMLESDQRAALAVLEHSGRLINEVAKEHAGTVIKTVGDTFQLEFSSAASAVECARRIQNRLHEENQTRRPQERYDLRIGIHLGDIWFFEDEALGDAITIAARLQNLAKPGGICISADVRAQIRGRLEADLVELGTVDLKEIGREIPAYQILTDSAGAGPAEIGRAGGPPAASEAGGSVEYGLSELKIGSLMRRLAPLAIQVNEGAKSKQIRVNGAGIHIWDGKSERQISIGKGGLRLTGPRDRPPAARGEPEGEPSGTREYVRSVPIDLINHAAAYGLVNGLLLLLNAITGPGFGHPWFLYPAGAWMIGLASHATAAVLRRRYRRENATRLPAEQRRALKKLQAHERGFAAHATAFLSVNGYLFMIYLLTSPGGFPWPLIPAAGWGIGFVFHWINSSFRRRQLQRRLESAGVDRRELRRNAAQGSVPGDTAGLRSEWDRPGGNRPAWDREPYAGLVAEAQRIKQGLVRELASSREVSAEWGSDFGPLLDTYFNQIRELQTRSRELRRIAQDADMAHVGAELRVLLQKRESAGSEQLKAEYEKSIKTYGRQLKAYEELCTEQEIIDLRLKSAVMMLKRLQMDFARIKNVSALSDRDVLSQVKQKTRELSRYLDDLRSSYAELEEEL